MERAGRRCEGCGVPHGALIAKGRTWETRMDWRLLVPGTAEVPSTEIVLTIAHLDQDPTNNADENLRAWCQLCHITHDAPFKAIATRERNRLLAAGGAPDLFPTTGGDHG